MEDNPIRQIVMTEYEDRIEIGDEVWDKKWVDKSYTGHIYHMSTIETSSDCGNCDGAQCDSCELAYTVWIASIPNRPFFSTRRFGSAYAAEEYLKNL